MLKPLSPLFQAVFRSKVSEPGFPLSMKPFLALENAIEFRTTWFAGGLSVMPSLNPLPSPLKSVKPHRLKPLPQAHTSSIYEHLRLEPLSLRNLNYPEIEIHVPSRAIQTCTDQGRHRRYPTTGNFGSHSLHLSPPCMRTHRRSLHSSADRGCDMSLDIRPYCSWRHPAAGIPTHNYHVSIDARSNCERNLESKPHRAH